MTGKHIAKLEMQLALGALERIAEGLREVTKENASTSIDQIVNDAKADINHIERIREARQLADIPIHEK